MRAILAQNPNAEASDFLNGLDIHNSAGDYLEDYLAFEYIRERYGTSPLHNFVRDVVRRHGDIKGALQYTLQTNWSDFQAGARKYAEERLFGVGRNLRSREVEKAY